MTVSAISWLPPGPCRWDFEPPKVAVVLDKATWTRQLLERAGTFVLQVPCAAQADLVQTVGTTSGAELDKFAAYGLRTFNGEHTEAPLLEGCVAWLECRLLPEPHIQQTYDLFLGEVVAAYADERVFSEGHWHFEGFDQLRTLHHVAGGHFLMIGQPIDGQQLTARRLSAFSARASSPSAPAACRRCCEIAGSCGSGR